MLHGIRERIEKTNEQRITMALLITNVMKSPLVDITTKSAMVATMLDMLDNSMIEEDDALIKHLNDAIKSVNEEAKEYGHDDLIGTLKRIRKQVKEKMERVEEGESILKSMNLDNFNLN